MIDRKTGDTQTLPKKDLIFTQRTLKEKRKPTHNFLSRVLPSLRLAHLQCRAFLFVYFPTNKNARPSGNLQKS